MASTRIRVCAVGRQQDMLRLCRYLLRNDEESLSPEATLEQLVARILHLAHEEGLEGSQFLYEMVADRLYGDAREETCRMNIREESCGLYTALFAYESESLFQPSDWLAVHQACGMPLFVLRASEEFYQEKGMLILSGGRAHDNWERMAEAWLYLNLRYGADFEGRDPRKVRKTLVHQAEDEDFEMTVGEMLDACVENLTELQEFAQAAEENRQEIETCRQEKDFQGLFYFFGKAAETRLWDIDHAEEHIAQVESLKETWGE